jgi:ABC-type Fe3+ transport system permease subunit
MNKFFLNVTRLLAILLIPFTIAAVTQVSAANVFEVCDGTAKNTEVCKNVDPGNPGTNPIIKGIKIAITVLSIIVGVAAVIMIIIGGLSFVTANGDAQAIARARSSILYALVGVVIVVMAQTLVLFVLDRL